MRSVFIEQSSTVQKGFSDTSGWVILSPIEARIKEKIEAVGIPLKDWDIKIYRGILTGYNEAFIIDEDTKNKLIDALPKNAEIIRPILRGRDIKQFKYSFSNKWLINTHNGNKGKGIARINVERDYPAVFQHLCGYSSQLQQRLDKGDHWSNLRNCAYLDDFEKEKIICIELTDRPNFALDINGYYLNNTIFFMTGEKLKYILGFLNTKLCEWYFDKIAATSGVGTRRWIKIYMDELPIPVVDQQDESHLTSLVTEVSNNENLTTARKKSIRFSISSITLKKKKFPQ